MDGFEKRTKEKMKAIEEVTISMLNMELNDIKIADIAKKAKVSQVTIYNYYGSKEKLIESAVKGLIDEQVQKFEEIIDADHTFKEKLQQFFNLKRHIACKINMLKLAEEDKKYGELLSNYYKKILPSFIKFIQTGREKGFIRESVKNETLTFYLRLIDESLSHLNECSMPNAEYEQIPGEILDLLLYGILKQDNI